MVLDGLVHAGNVKLNGQQMDFSYEAFTIDFNTIEAVHLSVNDPKMDYRGRPKKIWLNNSLQDISANWPLTGPSIALERQALSIVPRIHKQKRVLFTMTGPTCTAAHMKGNFYAVEPFQLSGPTT